MPAADVVERCFHCQQTVPPGTDYVLETPAGTRRFCCPGCRAVADLIESAGLGSFYEFRSAPAERAPVHDGDESPWSVCDRPEVAKRLVRPAPGGLKELAFRVNGVNCAACTWLIDRGLMRNDGVEDVSVNPVSREALVRFDPERIRISEILAATERFGFAPHLGSQSASGKQAARDELKRLAVAGLGFAQVMTLSAALYLGAFKAMDASFTSFFELASMLIATPVVLYSGAPIFRAALSDALRGRVGMDLPVALAVALALGFSLVNALGGEGPVYFDSATMFVFFLTLGRFLEARARHRAGGLVAALAELKPLSALRRRGGQLERVGTVELDTGDRVVVAPGEGLPADGELVSQNALLDESLLSGESVGRRREKGDVVLGGSLNVGGSPIDIRVTADSNDGYIERVGSLLNRAMADRPPFLRLADRWARYFILVLLAATAAVGVVWALTDPARTVDVVLAMLVVTCPCALSLAAPTAYAVALGRLARIGLLCRSARVLERLGQVTDWFFDKTGTLTEGRIGIVDVETYGALTADAVLAVASSLEAGIEHPIGRALRAAADAAPAEAVDYSFGLGVSGRVDGRPFRLGSARFVGRSAGAAEPNCVWLADEAQILAKIVLADRLRPHAREAVATIADRASVELVSGDEPLAVADVAAALGIERYAALQTPEDKLARLSERQAGGDVVAAVGDGINDAPLLARADVSIAMVAGSQLARASADIVFTGDDLRTLASLPALARATERVVRQNLGWAAVYNLAAVPLAAAGVLAPWMAAIGMSVSSLVVVGNALRLNRILAPSASRTPDMSLPPMAAAGRVGQ